MQTPRWLVLACLTAFLSGLSIRAASSEDGVSRKLASFFQAYQVIHSQALQKPNGQDLMNAAATGMVRALGDPYSQFLPSEHFASMEAEKNGEIVGIGMELAYRNQQVHVMTVLENTPAERAGLQSGELIEAIDNTPISDLSWLEINQRLHGKRNSSVTLKVRNENGEERSVSLKREVLNLKAVELQHFDRNICQLKVYTFFNENLYDQAQSALLNAGSCSALILDLQNNPGGLLDEALKLAGALGVQGTVVQIVSREGKVQELSSTEAPLIPPVPMVVLINEGTASAAEVLAASLRESGRALLVGEQSFGKARVQSLLPLADGAGLSLTTDKYLTRKGFDINGKGLRPDVGLELIPGERTALNWSLDYLWNSLKP